MDALLTGLRAIAENTRLRIVHLLAQDELNVSELVHILEQSQPRVSRHLKVLADAGLLERYKEGSWVLFRLADSGPAAAVGRLAVSLVPPEDPAIRGDLSRLAEVRAARTARAADYFSRAAADWDKIRALHVSEAEVEAAMRAAAGPGRHGLHLDLGTGTGRMLTLFAPVTERAIGVDLSREMLAIARAHIAAQGLTHLQVRQADLLALPFEDSSADLITLHQVLHFLDDPGAALAEAARVLRPGRPLLIADFAPHELESLRAEHAHRRLGFSPEQMRALITRAGLRETGHRLLPPPETAGGEGLSVSVWSAARSL